MRALKLLRAAVAMHRLLGLPAWVGLAAFAVCGLAAMSIAQEPGRDGTRVEMVERFCGRSAKCKKATRSEIARGRTVQGVIMAMGESLLDRNWANSDRAYDAMTRALLFTYDFMSAAELGAGQIEYSGAQAEALRTILGDAAWVCEVRGAFPSKYHCLKRRLASFEPGWPPLSAADASER